MMNEQVVLTEGDYGIELKVTILDKKKKPFNLSGHNIVITFVNPYGIKTSKKGFVLDNAGGICSYILSKDDTNEPELWTTYWSVYDKNGRCLVTTQEALYYYVLPKHGGK